jgi:hypothetical protein
VTPLYRELLYQCTDDTCGHAFRAELAITHTFWPSMRPCAGVKLPLLGPAHDNDNSRQAALAN